MFLIVTFEILGLLVNTLTDDDNYSLCNSENLQQQIPMHLYKEQKNVFRTFCYISEIYVKFFKKDDPHNLSISEIMDCKKRA